MGERLVCNQEAIGSIPFTSTIPHHGARGGRPDKNGWIDDSIDIRGAKHALLLFDNRFRMRCPKFFHALSSGQANKGARWMPWRQEAMKDVAGCDKLR